MSQSDISTIPISAILTRRIAAIFENPNRSMVNLSRITKVSSSDESTVIRTPRYPTSFRGKNENEVIEWSASLTRIECV